MTAWKDVVADKQQRLDATIPQEWRLDVPKPEDGNVLSYPSKSSIMTADELSITESSAAEIVKKIAAGKLTSVAVTTAFCKRAAMAHQLVSDVTNETYNVELF